MSVREYIGARYVPMFADPVAWDSTKTYEPLTVVIYLGNSYTSRQYVPAGIDISNGSYWVQTGNYNAQIDQYRSEVTALAGLLPSTEFTSTNTVKKYVDDEIDAIENIIGGNFDSTNTVAKAIDDVDDKLGTGFDSTNTVAKAIDDVDDKLGTGFDSTNTVAKAIDDVDDKLGTGFDSTNTVAKAIDDVDDKLGTGFDSTNTVKKYVDDEISPINADGWVTPKRIALSSVVPHLLVIGDSWSVSTSGMISKLATRMNIPQGNVHNFAVGGTGFLMSETPNFASQLASAIADNTIPRNVPMYIAVIGGTNDLSNGFTTASQYVTVIDNMYDAIVQNFPMGIPIFFFMQAAKNRIYPYTLIKSVRAASKAQIVNMAWPIPLQFFSDNMHPTTDGYTIAAEFIASNFGFGTAITRAVSGEIQIQDQLNSVLTDNAVQNANIRLAWTEHTLTGYVFINVNSEIANGDFLDFLNLNINCPVRPTGMYMLSPCVAMGIDSKFLFGIGDNRIAVRNHTTLPVGIYIAECTFVWA